MMPRLRATRRGQRLWLIVSLTAGNACRKGDATAMDSPNPPTGRHRPESKWDDALEILGWLNPLTLVTAIATGIAEVVGRLFRGKRR